MSNNNNVSDMLMEILKFSSENNYMFEMKNDDDESFFNIIDSPEKKIVISIPDFKDEKLYDLLDENFEKLKNLTK